MYRLVSPSEGWSRLLWRSDHTHPLSVVRKLDRLSAIPGIKVDQLHATFPSNTWLLPTYRELLEDVDIDPFVFPLPRVGVFESERQLFKHQLEGVDYLLATPGVLLADDMGLGKTTTAAVAALKVQAATPTRPGLTIGPLAVQHVWERELRAVGFKGVFCALSSRDLTDPSWDPKADWYFVHYDVLYFWWSKIILRKPCVTIADEAHNLKNGRSQRARGAMSVVGVSPVRYLLTGTPVENKPQDLWNLLQLVSGPGAWGSPLDFRKRYCGATFNGHGHTDNEPTHTDELRTRLETCYLRRTADIAGLEMPPLTRQLLRCSPLNKALQHEHDNVLAAAGGPEALVRAILSGDLRSNVLETLVRLRQVTGQAKIVDTANYVNDLVDQGEGVVIFCWERRTVELLAARVAQRPFTITGDDTLERRQGIIDTFQATPGSVLIATLGSIREGVTLHTARICVMHDLHPVLTHMLQAERRVYRIGQRRACQSVWMYAEKSIDVVLARMLYKKAQDMNDMLNLSDALHVATDLQLEDAGQLGAFDQQVRDILDQWERW